MARWQWRKDVTLSEAKGQVSARPPQVGMLALVRNRRGLITSVESRDGTTEGRLNLVTVEYLDPDGDLEDQLVWEREVGAEVLPPAALPDVAGTGPMLPGQLDAVVRATRWSALTPFLDPDGAAGILEALPVSAPYHGAIQAEDYQLVPLLKALRMPRVSLLLADDVGLGKTIEAGLILTELLLRRRVRRVLIVCPASLRQQWKEELDSKFCLAFDIVDRPATHLLQRRLGLEANPWRSYSRIITSFDYLKQPDVFGRFVAGSRVPEGAPHAAWDLLIVDEAHNLAPAPVGEDSEAARLLRRLTPLFEHRLFLTATPHNGHTRSFTGLLEALDPVRFTRKSEPLTDNEKQRVEDVVIRRLKSEINAATRPPRFAERTVTAVPLAFGAEEAQLSSSFYAFRARIREIVAALPRGEQLAGNFAVEILNKRLLSCPATFADSWLRYREGAASGESVETREIEAAGRATAEDTGDDLETESRQRHAARPGRGISGPQGRMPASMPCSPSCEVSLPPVASGSSSSPSTRPRSTTCGGGCSKRSRNPARCESCMATSAAWCSATPPRPCSETSTGVSSTSRTAPGHPGTPPFPPRAPNRSGS